LYMILLPLELRRGLWRHHWSRIPIMDNRLYALEEESNDWKIWEIGSGREDRDGWPMLITADETGHGWLPFAVRSAIFSPSSSSFNSVASSWRHAIFVTLRISQGETTHHGKIHHLRRSYAECRRMTLMGDQASRVEACNEDMRQQTEGMPPSRLGRVPE